MNKVIFTLAASLSTLLHPGIQAQEKMSLKDCMQYAISHATQVRIQQTQTDDARLERRRSILDAFSPSLDAQTYAYSSWGRDLDPETNIWVNNNTLKNYWQVQAGITIFNGFSAIDNMKIAKTSQAMGLSKEMQEEDKVCLATIEAYYNVLYYSELSDILAKQVKAAGDAVKLAERQEELGSKGHADVIEMKADLADKEYELTVALNSFDDAMITLQDVMFWPPEEPLHIDTSLAAAGATENVEENTEQIIDHALNFHPKVFIAKGNMDNAARSLHTAKWQFLPKLDLYAGWSSNAFTYPNEADYSPDPYFAQLKNRSGEFVQANLSIPIYTKLQKNTTMNKRKNELERATLEYDKVRRDVESEVHRAVQDRDGAHSAMLQAQTRAEVQDEAFKLNTRKYELGLISSIEFNTASGNFLKAQAVYLQSQLKYQLKKRVVSYYNGIRYIEQ